MGSSLDARNGAGPGPGRGLRRRSEWDLFGRTGPGGYLLRSIPDRSSSSQDHGFEKKPQNQVVVGGPGSIRQSAVAKKHLRRSAGVSLPVQAVDPGNSCLPEIRDVIYETFIEDQARFGPPRNPAHLLRKGELVAFFSGWEFLHVFEGELPRPARAMAQLVARKPG